MIIFHWDIPAAFAHGKAAKKYWTRWSHTAKAFGVTDIGIVEIDPVPEFGDSEVNVTVFASLDDAIAGRENLVFVEEGGEPYQQFQFPDNPTFVFGGDYGQLPRADISIAEAQIPLHADIACAIVLAEWRQAGWP